MRIIVLRRGGGYKYKDIIFEFGVPKVVDEEIADHLLSLGRFAVSHETPPLENDATGVPDGISMLGGPPEGYIEDRKNTIEHDNLNGKRVLLRRRGGIGDLVFVTVFAEYLKATYPECSISIAVPDKQVEFVQCFDVYDRILTLDTASNVHVVGSYHYIIPFEKVLGSESPASSDIKEYFQAHWERAGMPEPCPDKVPLVRINQLVGNLDAQTKAMAELRRIGFGTEDYVVLLLGTSNPLKRLTQGALKSISHELASVKAQRSGHSRLRVLCLGGKDDRAIRSETPWVACCNDLPIQVSAELVRKARCVIGADTGLLHFAAAIGAPTVSLWGPTNPDHTIPRYSAETRVVKSTLDCVPCSTIRAGRCDKYRGGYTECMRIIDVRQAIEYARDLCTAVPVHAASLLTAEQVLSDRKQRLSRYHIAVLLDHAGTYTGGGFYTWNLAKLLSSLPSTHVTVFTDVEPTQFVYTQDDIIPSAKDMSVVQHTGGGMGSWSSSLHFDLVIGTPPETGATAVNYAKAHGAKSVMLLYETPNYIAEHRKGRDGEEAYWATYKGAFPAADFIWVISKTVRSALYEWVDKLKTMKPSVWTIWPVINQAVANMVLEKVEEDFFEHKTDSVVMIARNMPYKQLRSAMQTIAEEGAKAAGCPLDLIIIGQDVGKLSKAISPDWKNCNITLLNSVTEQEKWQYLSRAKVVVHPSDFEGFGIPVAEGLYAGAQVITKPLRVLRDAYQDQIRTYTKKEELVTQLEGAFTDWRSLDELEEGMEREVGEHLAAENRQLFVKQHYVPGIIKAGISKALREDLAAYQKRAAKKRNDISVLEKDADIRVAVVSPWNVCCGVAETTRTMLEHLQYPYHVFSYRNASTLSNDGNEVSRCWTRDFSTYTLLLNQILDFMPSVVHIQHEHSLFQDQDKFFAFIKELKKYGLRVVVTLHTWLPSRFTDTLGSLVDVVINTKPQEDVQDNFTSVLLPVEPIAAEERGETRKRLGLPSGGFVVGAFGMWQVHKGYAELLDTYNDVSSVIGDDTTYLISGSSPPKSQYMQQVRWKIKELLKRKRILLLSDYPEMPEVVSRLAACNVLVFNYSIAHHSSASAAIRTGMQAGVPIICTTSPMFSEFTHEKEVLKVAFGDLVGLKNAILRIRKDKALGTKLVTACQEYLEQSTPEKIAEAHASIYQSVVYGNAEKETE